VHTLKLLINKPARDISPGWLFTLKLTIIERKQLCYLLPDEVLFELLSDFSLPEDLPELLACVLPDDLREEEPLLTELPDEVLFVSVLTLLPEDCRCAGCRLVVASVDLRSGALLTLLSVEDLLFASFTVPCVVFSSLPDLPVVAPVDRVEVALPVVASVDRVEVALPVVASEDLVGFALRVVVAELP